MLLATACAGGDASFPWEGSARNYLQRIADGGSLEGLYGQCEGRAQVNAHEILAGEGRGFEFSMPSSTRTGPEATVNVSITGQDGSPTLYHVDLREENDTWMVCDMGVGNVKIDVD
ncbi:hypothetical protein [Yinghuangia seranimata]|uniref:hypothetical protein n=1 Tax=Yinghuangia seranimata TaxID=408067 RepID=UPI00248AA101|nr:hypothetical protein [Yinghuangia seranimata]MDI2130881.1 hypothetical protein [Yinghuangia seranimata]